MLAFERKTEVFIERHSLLQKGDFVVLAVSGGPDSLAMLDFFFHRKAKYGINIAAVHVDHMLRGEESIKDLEFVKEYCNKRDIIFRSTAIDINNKMEIEKAGLQETARKYRYQYFREVMKELHANKLAVGHHGDDQIETILMRLVRGSGGISRAGILISRQFHGIGDLIRPLLAVSKAEIEEYCKQNKLEPRRDLSNEKKLYTRNRFRLDILPLLKKENTHVLEHFQRFNEHLSEDEQYLLDLAKKECEKMCHMYEEGEITLDIPLFFKVPLPLQRRVIHLILNYLYQQMDVDLTATHLDLLKQLLKGENPSSKLDFPKGLKIIRSYDTCCFTFVEKVEVSTYEYELIAGDQVVIPNGRMIQVEKAIDPSLKDENIFVFNQRDIQFPIIVRTRRPGDRIKGIGGTKKLKDLFIDMKVPIEDRSTWPVVTDYTGKLLWIPGLKKSCYSISTEPVHNSYLIRYSIQTFPGRQLNQ